VALKPGIGIHQKQRLAVTQKMQQSVAILGMSNAELLAFLKDELTGNPVAKISGGPSSSPQRSLPVDNIIADTEAAHETFISLILRQQESANIPQDLENPLQSIIEHLDERGFLDTSLTDIAKTHGYSISATEAALRIVQSFEPTGVGARDLPECLALQLKSDGLWSPEFEKLLQRLPGSFSRTKRLAQELNIPVEKLQAMIDTLKRYSLNPAATLDTIPPAHVIPDVLCHWRNTQELGFALNEEAFVRLEPDSAYLGGLLTSSQEVRDYLNTQMTRVNWLKRALEKRASTILSIAIAIGKFQVAFFKDGPMAMKPLKLGDIARSLDIHESTVSRAISGKYLTCDRGTFPLHYFFPSAIQNAQGKEISSTVIRFRLAHIFRSEDPKNVVSDTKATELLAREGITVARRTIAKYRRLMNVPASSTRRIQKRARSRS
jgi:RNA polymerase sigma-54 factor